MAPLVRAQAGRPCASQRPVRSASPLAAAALAAGVALSTPFAGLAATVTFDAVPNERWAALPATLETPEGYKARPGRSQTKVSKDLLYTDTYGPNYRYTATLPPLSGESGALAASVSLRQSALLGTGAITELSLDGVEPQRAFDLDVEDVSLAEVQAKKVRTDGAKQSYYEWDMVTPAPAGHHVLVSAAVSGGGLFVLAVDATPEQWDDHKDALKAMRSSLAIAPAEESIKDISERIYNSVPVAAPSNNR
mmetsp:Transcript_27535/g.94027  ORF Transcript_27535/g.94027 Transcript_27535/m.94027 type:complete len:250 (-) Transcript_27535:147-896(-)